MAARGRRVAIVQSNYIPWKGYFDLINSVDEFILFDDAQYTRRDWRNRNRVVGPSGPRWLTIPVEVKGRYLQAIKDTRIADDSWGRRHWETLRACYGRTPGFEDCAEVLEPMYRGRREAFLSEVNRSFLEAVNALLGIDTALRSSMDYELVEGRTQRLVHLCRAAGATDYLSGPAARAYLDEALFAEAGISVSWMDYGGYPEYDQRHMPFEHGVSILDLLFNCGSDARAHMLTFTP